MAKTLFIGNLNYETSLDTLQQAFAPYNPTMVRIQDGRGFGFVDLEDGDCDGVIEKMNGHEIDGRKIVVAYAREKTG